ESIQKRPAAKASTSKAYTEHMAKIAQIEKYIKHQADKKAKEDTNIAAEMLRYARMNPEGYDEFQNLSDDSDDEVPKAEPNPKYHDEVEAEQGTEAAEKERERLTKLAAKDFKRLEINEFDNLSG